MKELSIFIDESGDFGEYAPHSPYYIITMIFHNQDESIQSSINKLNQELSYLNLDNLCIHTGPIIRREGIYESMSVKERHHIFNKMVAFIRQINIRYKCFSIEKRNIPMSSKQPEGSQNKYHNLSASITQNFFLLMLSKFTMITDKSK